jgi:hypothetical protein
VDSDLPFSVVMSIFSVLGAALVVIALVACDTTRRPAPSTPVGTVVNRVADPTRPGRVVLTVRYPNGFEAEYRRGRSVDCARGDRYPTCAGDPS